MKLERGVQLGETYFKRSWAERAPGPPANSGDYEDGQALPTQGGYLRPGLKLSVRQTGVAAPPGPECASREAGPGPRRPGGPCGPHSGGSALCPSLGPRTGELTPPPRLARPAATEGSWAPGPGRLEAPLREKGLPGAPKCWGDGRAEQHIAGTCRAGLGAGARGRAYPALTAAAAAAAAATWDRGRPSCTAGSGKALGGGVGSG